MVMEGRDGVVEWLGCTENVIDWFRMWWKGWDRIGVSGNGAGVMEVDLAKFYVTHIVFMVIEVLYMSKNATTRYCTKLDFAIIYLFGHSTCIYSPFLFKIGSKCSVLKFG